MLEIKLDKQPERFLKKCGEILFKRITAKLNELKENPVPHNAVRVVGYRIPVFRIRIGKWRATYRINHEERKIIVVKIGRRDKVYQ